MKTKFKKGKITMIITIAIACFALALIMTMQFKIVNETDITAIENMRETELRTELANWQEKYNEVNSQYEETVSRIDEYKKTSQSNEETEKLVNQELDNINLLLGNTDVQGQGIEITINETNNEEIEKITADDLLLIINSLKQAGAEAISINDERIVNMTDVVYIDAADIIRVNGQRVLAPYVIKAIGNQTYLESAMLGNGGQIDSMKKVGQDVKIEKKDNIKITKYSGEFKTRYME